ncbi:hypothetical protein F5X99DRAFT_380750 [Biscogniauxia marginata]|nr:hypothetical protein F5X99DRAFT_380750 [Biscogniauxia marginata]
MLFLLCLCVGFHFLNPGCHIPRTKARVEDGCHFLFLSPISSYASYIHVVECTLPALPSPYAQDQLNIEWTISTWSMLKS